MPGNTEKLTKLNTKMSSWAKPGAPLVVNNCRQAISSFLNLATKLILLIRVVTLDQLATPGTMVTTFE